MKHRINLAVTTIAPLHISSGETGLYLNTDSLGGPSVGRSEVYYSSKGTVPATRTERLRLPATEAGKTSDIPIAKGNTLRGRIRREAAKVVMEHLSGRSEKVSLDLFHILTCGARTASPDGNTSIERNLKAAKHPFSGLLGGGPQMFRSRLVTGTAFPVSPRTIELGLVDESFADCAVSADETMLQPLTFVKRDDLLDFSNLAASRLVENYPKALVEWCDSVEKRQGERAIAREAKAAAKKEAKAARAAGTPVAKPTTPSEDPTKLGLKTYTAREYVIPGVTFVSRQIVDDDGPGLAALGLYLHALMGLAQHPYIGGETRNGVGHVLVRPRILSDGVWREVFIDSNGSAEFNLPVPVVAAALDAWAEALPAITASSLEDVFSSYDDGKSAAA